MDVLKKVVAKPGWITSHVVAMLFVAFASCGAVFFAGSADRRSHAVSPRC
jgi:hypothetical protein